MSTEEQQTEDTDLLGDNETLDPKPEEKAEDTKSGSPGVDDNKDDTLSDDTSGDLLSDDDDTGQNSDGTSFEFEVPEDLQDMQFDDGALDAFKKAAAAAGLSQEQFQALAEFDARNALAAQKAWADEQHQVVAGWKQSVIDDKDIGGENLSVTRQNAKAAISKFADPELKSLLKSASEDNPDGTGLGNHPVVMKFLNRIGKALADPDFVGGEEPPKDKDTLRKMYPSMYQDEAA